MQFFRRLQSVSTDAVPTTVGFAIWLLVSFCCFLTPNLSAQQSGASQYSMTEIPVREKPGLLVLHGGRVIRGHISRGINGYVISTEQSSIIIPELQVQIEAKDLVDAYRKLRSMIKTPSANQHVGLAQWCMTYELYSHARVELRDALHLTPSHDQARSMLQRLEQKLNPHKIISTPKPKASKIDEDGFDEPDSQSLSGLSRETAHLFIRQIQPILVNNCGNGSCHGSGAKNRFQLTHVRIGYGAHQIHAERNLAMVIREIDFDSPSSSPILKRSQDGHARSVRYVFRGFSGQKQRDKLEEWVYGLIKEKTGREIPEVSPFAQNGDDAINGSSAVNEMQSVARPIGDAALKQPGQFSPIDSGPILFDHKPGGSQSKNDETATSVQSLTNVPKSLDDPTPATTSSDTSVPRTFPPAFRTKPYRQPVKPEPPSSDPYLKKILDEERDDPFDPEEFNRRFRRNG